MRQELRLRQQLVLTPQLQQAIKLLQLSRLELVDLLRNELLENPVLEEAGELGGGPEEAVSSLELQDGLEHQPAEAPELAEPTPLTPEGVVKDAVDWDAYLEQHANATPEGAGLRRDDELAPLEATLTRPQTPYEHLWWQIRLSQFEPAEERIAEAIIGALSPAGYLAGTDVWQLASDLGVSTLEVELVLRRIQQLDPIAIASRTLAEALWIQTRHPDHPIEDPLVAAIIAKHLGALERRSYAEIAKQCDEPLEEVYEAVKVVLALEPRPARSLATESAPYVTPDVYVHRIGDDFVVSLNDDGLPRLRIANYYRQAAQRAGAVRDYVAERLRSAHGLLRSIQQRQRTILRVAESVVKFQREFFEHGPAHLRPLVLRDVAVDIEMHESTVSRVTTNKYVHTPHGIFEFKYFFSAAIVRDEGGNLASEAVKAKVEAFIAAEDPAQPLSDQAIVDLLAREGIDIARRTVAKYREQLGHQPSSKRKKLF